MDKISVQTVLTFSKERINDLLCGAFEGGSTYWCEKATINRAPTEPYEWLHEVPMAEGSLILSVADGEGAPQPADLNSAACARGLQLMAEDWSRHFQAFRDENEDAETGDVFLQLCVFGDVVFS